MKRLRRACPRLLWAATLLLQPGCFHAGDDSSRAKADRHLKEKKYEEAIAEYQAHIEARLAVRDRPAWENPYLYLLDIGDVYLEQGNVDEALRQYEAAEAHGVKQGYVNDRYRQIANWYESRGEYEKALHHLEKYREKDAVIFDMMLDRVARKAVQEQQSLSEPGHSRR